MQILIRTLPAIVVVGLAFIVAADKKSRERWAEWMYQIGNVRNDQRSDPKVQNGVRLPFFVASVLLLIIPIRFFWVMNPTRNVQIVPQASVAPRPTADTVSASATPSGTAEPTPTPPPVSSGPISVK